MLLYSLLACDMQWYADDSFPDCCDNMGLYTFAKFLRLPWVDFRRVLLRKAYELF